MAKIQSVEPNIADLANGWLKAYGLDYKLEQESLNAEIDQALNDYYSKKRRGWRKSSRCKAAFAGQEPSALPCFDRIQGL